MARRAESGTSSPLHVSAESQLRIALDNMPGALVYTDAAQAIVFCNDRFREMYAVPPALLTPGRPYADLAKTDDLIDAKEVGELTLKGFQRPVLAYNVRALLAGSGAT